MILKNILTKEECEYLHQQFLIEKNINADVENHDKFGPNTYGFRPSDIFNKYMDTLKPHIQKCIGNDYIFENVNTYIREYKNGSSLIKHTDRLDIGITLSINLFSNINKIWPLYEERDGNELAYEAETGDGIIILDPHKIIHWRDTLVCNDDEYVLQFFVHWILKKGNKTLL